MGKWGNGGGPKVRTPVLQVTLPTLAVKIDLLFVPNFCTILGSYVTVVITVMVNAKAQFHPTVLA